MPRKRRTQELYVSMNGRPVGRLLRAAGGVLSFRYEAQWLEDEDAAPISLTMPLSPDPYSEDVVYNFFDNLLPDNREIRRRMQSTLETPTTQPFDLLAGAGADCVGALQLLESPAASDVRQVTAEAVSNSEIARTLREYRSHPLGMAHEGEFRISLAGAQEKTAFLWYQSAWHRPTGATPTTHIFKQPIGVVEGFGFDLRDSVENEWLCLKIAAELGLPVPFAEIQQFEDARVLVVERFDRNWSADATWLIRLPQEDMCQALGLAPGSRYESDGGPGIRSTLDLLLQSVNAREDRLVFFRANLVYWLLAATDGHGKNFSIFLRPGGRCSLTPFYDILSAYPLVATGQLPHQKLRMAMAVSGKNRHREWDRIQRRHWLSTAKECRLPERDVEALIQDCLERVEPAVEKVRAVLPGGFPDAVAGPVLDGLMKARDRMTSAS